MDRDSGRHVVLAVWLLVVVDLVLALVTYARLPARDLYNVSGTGLAGGLSRAIVETNYPAALIAVAVLLAIAPRPRWLAWTAGVLCLVVVVPGVVDIDNLDAKPVNALPAIGVLLAFALSMRTRVSPARPAGPARIALAVAATLICVDWIAAALGFYLDGVPLLGSIFQTGRTITSPPPPHPAVHHGIHHGWQGLLLILTGLLLTRLPLSRPVTPFFALLIAYGLGDILNDGSTEQIVERGWTSSPFPDVLRPALNWGWAAVLVGAAVIWVVWLRHAADRR
ncbi:MAG TPA: hypothetical protein VLK36_10515 [Gaiellaceae bacterium]|nr:hypothetical protein [Gaiellaceae bacterium]